MLSQTLAKRLDEIGHRHRRVSMLVLVIRALLVAWFGATLLRAAATIGWHSPSHLASAIVFIALGAAAFGFGYRPPLDRRGLARLTDRRLQLKDRLATAVEWSEKSSPLVDWLIQDAEQQARFVDPKEVVPFPRPSAARGAVLLASLLLSVALWAAPLPSGLFVRPVSPTPGEGALNEETELLREIAALRDLISQIATAQARRLDRDLAQLHAGLRDRSIPKDEAVALLKHFERRAQSALAAQQGMDGSDADPALDRLQEIAERLTVVARQGVAQQPSGGPGSEPAYLGQRELSESEVSPELLELLRRIGEENDSANERAQPGSATGGETASEQTRSSSEQSTPDALPDQAGGQRGSMPTEESEVGDSRRGQSSQSPESVGTGLPGQADGTAPTGTEQGDAASPHGTSDTGTGAGQSGSPVEFASIRILEHLPGDLLDGPVHAGQIQASFGGDAGSAPIDPTFARAAGQGEGAQSVTRESVPLAYREAVRTYFQSLEPSTGP